jgi:membrane associated rhomboid family serine protease
MKALLWVTASVLCVCYAALDIGEMGYSATSRLYTHVTYMFCHVNVFHLLVNELSLVCVWRLCGRLNIIRESAVISFVSAVSGSFVPYGDSLTVGMSGFVYGMVSVMYGGILSGRLIVEVRRLFVYFTISIAAGLMSGFIIRGVNGAVHASSFVTGLALSWSYYYLKGWRMLSRGRRRP